MNLKYTVGTEVAYGRFHLGSPLSYGFSTIAHINGYGHVKLENGLVFDKHGYERGVGYGQRHLMPPSRLQAALDAQEEQRQRRDKIARIKGTVSEWASGRPISDEIKQEMISLINSL